MQEIDERLDLYHSDCEGTGVCDEAALLRAARVEIVRLNALLEERRLLLQVHAFKKGD